MDYLSYIEDANSAINMDDYTIYNAIDAIQGIQQGDYDTLTQKMVGSQLNQSSREQAAQAKSLGEAIQNGDYAAGATSAGTMILGRAKAFELAAKTRDAIFGKAEPAPEEGTVTETAEPTLAEEPAEFDAPVDTLAGEGEGELGEAGVESVTAAMRAPVGGAAAGTDAGAVAATDSGAVAATDSGVAGAGLTAEDLVAAGLDPAGTSEELGAALARMTARYGTGFEAESKATEGVEVGVEESKDVEPAEDATYGYLNTYGGVQANESLTAESLAGLGRSENMAQPATETVIGESGAEDLGLMEGRVAAGAETDLSTLGYGTALESGPAAATSVGVEMSGTAAQNTAQGFSSISGTTEPAATTTVGGASEGAAAGVGVDASKIATIDTVGDVGDTAGIAAGDTAATVGTEAGVEVGVEAGATALEAAGLALQAVPFADIIGAGLLIGGASIAPIMDAVDKKKEKKEKKKAKKKAKKEEAAAQSQYNQAVTDHNTAIQSLNSNHHSAITGGIQQQTATAVGSASF